MWQKTAQRLGRKACRNIRTRIGSDSERLRTTAGARAGEWRQSALILEAMIARSYAPWIGLLLLACTRPDEDRPAKPLGAPLASSSAAKAASSAPPTRPATWAEKLTRPHLPNLHRVTTTLYRGAQPDDEGFPELKALGIKTVENLRFMHSDRSETKDIGLDYVKVAEEAWEAEDDETLAFLKIAI